MICYPAVQLPRSALPLKNVLPRIFTSLTALLLVLGLPGCSVSVTVTPLSTTALCKNGGWRSLQTRDGRAFDSQAECVSQARTE